MFRDIGEAGLGTMNVSEILSALLVAITVIYVLIAKKANALRVLPILQPGDIEVDEGTWGGQLRLKSLQNVGQGTALNVSLGLYQVVDGGLEKTLDLMPDELTLLSIPPGETPIPSFWALLPWKDLWARDRECNTLMLALTLDYEDALNMHHAKRFDILAEYGRTTPKSVTQAVRPVGSHSERH